MVRFMCRAKQDFFVICMWMILVQKGIFTSITHKCPEIGHSWMPSDRDVGLIEKKVRMKEYIYDTASYRDCIIQAKNDKPFEVREMKGHFIDIKEEIKKRNLVNKKINTKGENVELRDKVKQLGVMVNMSINIH